MYYIYTTYLSATDAPYMDLYLNACIIDCLSRDFIHVSVNEFGPLPSFQSLFH